MDENGRIYIAIDLKSFYASAECTAHGFDPLKTHLVVADESRTDKTICLAVSPSLKALGISGRARLFEVRQKVRDINRLRQRKCMGGVFSGKSIYPEELEKDPSLALDFYIAVPRMAYYMECSAKIYSIYLRYIAPEDIHVYSIDEVFMDVTSYLKTYGMTARQLASAMIKDVLKETGITATAGIGTNLYLAKVAMDIVAKHIPADKDGVRIAGLDERTYRKLLWTHEPLTDFWRVGKGYAKRLEENFDLHTMGDIARFSLTKDDLLYREFGVNAELLIDHAWGCEPCTIADIKAYQPSEHSVGSGQVLMEPYPYEKAKIVLKEMTDSLALELAEKGLVTDMISLVIGYDTGSAIEEQVEVKMNRWGVHAAKNGNKVRSLPQYTSSGQVLMSHMLELYDQTVAKNLMVRRLYVTALHVIPKEQAVKKTIVKQMDLFSEPEEMKPEISEEELAKEEKVQQAMLDIRHRFGKNAVLKGTSLEKGATGKERNKLIGGHKA